MDKKAQLQRAASLPKGSPERRAILASLSKDAGRKWGPVMFEEGGDQHGHKLTMSMFGDPDGGGVIDGHGEAQFSTNEDYLAFLMRLRRFIDSGIQILQRS